MYNVISSLVLAAGGGLLGVVVKHFLDNPFREIAFNLPWLRVKAGSLAGFWLAEYSFRECGDENTHVTVSALYELIEWPGNIVLIREMKAEGESAAIVIKAKKRNNYLTGTYENADDDDLLHGVFQLWIHPRGKEMRGNFLGFSAESPNKFNVGDWSWARVTRNRKKESLEEAQAKYAEHLAVCSRGDCQNFRVQGGLIFTRMAERIGPRRG